MSKGDMTLLLLELRTILRLQLTIILLSCTLHYYYYSIITHCTQVRYYYYYYTVSRLDCVTIASSIQNTCVSGTIVSLSDLVIASKLTVLCTVPVLEPFIAPLKAYGNQR
jgi:hypothetical protein